MATLGTQLDHTVTSFEDQLALWGAKLEAMVAKAKVVGQEAKNDRHAALDDLRGKLDAARAKLDQAKAAGASGWDTVKSGVATMWNDVEGAFQKLTA
ncbi:MAG: hypothetical protein KBG28_19770 [Kofleriaceae bacterium]|jgi:hypothetical protein|nr:hypothetical protein [Kofleriaceae bacterium]MBP6839065.1 hypothetical protein [Kofleriaceae bacterium]MBP9206220.1 hypothetical protein [Kofleriaceae bacterium]